MSGAKILTQHHQTQILKTRLGGMGAVLMALLWLVTLGWAFSFSLIGVYLAGQVDDFISVLIRTVLASLLFLPMMLRRWPGRALVIKLMAIGGIQIGLMYVFLFQAFSYLSVPEVLLFTIFTPLYITLFDELWQRRLHLPMRWWMATLLAVAGAAIIRWHSVSPDALLGFLLIQSANICFALGQVSYRRLKLGAVADQVRDFGFFFVGGALVATVAALIWADGSKMPQTATQWGVLLWLGLGASGLGYLAWNTAARWVNTAQLAVMNNMLIPIGILVNMVLWHRAFDGWSLLLGGGLLLLAMLVATDRKANPSIEESA